MNIVATVEARMTSSRLPGKVLRPILGRPMLQLLLERLGRSDSINKIVVATTVNQADDPVAKLCQDLGVSFFRGSEEDVLDRVLRAAKSVHADLIVEMTGDCPLLDPDIVDRVINFYLKNDYDYVSNVLQRSFPRGLDTQVFSTQILDEVSRLTQDPADRENVSLYIYEHPRTYKIGNVKADDNLNWPSLRLCVDTYEDFDLITRIYETLYPNNPSFSTQDVLEVVKRNQWHKINAAIVQKSVR